jgi:SAM-dependent methyltransferase
MAEDHASERLLAEQAAYYRARAGEYDEWFLRQGRYDHGVSDNALWFAEVDQVRRALEGFCAAQVARRGHPLRILELACGTGLWTAELARLGDGGGAAAPPLVAEIVAVDAAPEMLRRAEARLAELAPGPRVTFAEVDLFADPVALPATAAPYDAAFLGFWMSHVPESRLTGLWALLRASLDDPGAVFFVDSRATATSMARDHVPPETESQTAERRLNDGRQFRVVKVFYEPRDLERRLADLGWAARVEVTPTYFILGEATGRER